MAKHEPGASVERLSTYLWDASGPVEPSIAALEDALRPWRADRRALPVPAVTPVRRHRSRLLAAVALAAGLVAAVAGWHAYRLAWPAARPWAVTWLPAGGTPAAAARADEVWPVGGILQTPADQAALVRIARIGQLRIEPGSRVRLATTGTGTHRLALDHGRLHARVWAPPGQFGVLTAGGVAVDLGCEFVLASDADGRGVLDVRSGWVGYQSVHDEILVPAGFVAELAPGGAASSPLRPQATAAVREAVHAVDAAMRGEGDAAPAAERLAAAAEPADAMTLLAVLTRYPGLAATALYPRLGALLGLRIVDPAHRARWIGGDRAAITAWWDALPGPRPKQWWLSWRDGFGPLARAAEPAPAAGSSP